MMTLKRNAFLYLYVLYLLIGAYLLIMLQKEDLVIWFNEHHTELGDIFFKYFTHAGDGLFFIAVCVLMLFVNYFKALTGIITYASSAIFAQVLKHTLFAEMKRPSALIDNALLHHVEGVEWHCCNSFPSGHSTSAFAMFLWLSLLTKNRLLQVLFFTCAVLVTFSRMYLSQHFFMDTYFGSIIGTSLALFVYLVFNRTSWAKSKKWNKKLI
jgi:membrane-associated phospholipid phosphatase